MSELQLRLTDAYGVPLAYLAPPDTLDYTARENQPSVLKLTLPNVSDPALFQWDYRIELSRTVTGAPQLLDVLLIDRVTVEPWQLTIEAGGLLGLLGRRIVAYPASDTASYSNKTAPADNMMKAIVRENLGTLATDTTRSWSSLISVAADVSAAPSTTRAFAYANVLDTLQKLADESAQNGTYLVFDVVPTGDGSTFEFRTYTGQSGVDRRLTTNNGLLLDPELGNVVDTTLDRDYTGIRTYLYAGGQGQQNERTIATASDLTMTALSPFGRVEDFSDARNSNDVNAIQAEAKSALRAAAYRLRFSGTLVEQDGATFGEDYGLGDLVTVSAFGTQFDCRIDNVSIALRDEQETVTSKLVSL